MDEENTVKSRLKAFVAYLNMSEREFCRTIGVNRGIDGRRCRLL